jgi:hypothetical protein
MNSASLSSLAGRYDNPLSRRFLAPIDSLKIPALCPRLGCYSETGSIHIGMDLILSVYGADTIAIDLSLSALIS